MYTLLTAIRIFIVYAIFLGVLYPLLIAYIGHLAMPNKADGSLIVKDGKIVGSSLIGQNFTGKQYFHSRFSDVNYNAANSGASNFGPSNKKFLAEVGARIQKIRAENELSQDVDIPADMVLSSASGLDPHISYSNAMLQLPRVAEARNLPRSRVKRLITKNTDADFVGIFGQEGVNVLKLNLALDALGEN